MFRDVFVRFLVSNFNVLSVRVGFKKKKKKPQLLSFSEIGAKAMIQVTDVCL